MDQVRDSGMMRDALNEALCSGDRWMASLLAANNLLAMSAALLMDKAIPLLKQKSFQMNDVDRVAQTEELKQRWDSLQVAAQSVLHKVAEASEHLGIQDPMVLLLCIVAVAGAVHYCCCCYCLLLLLVLLSIPLLLLSIAVIGHLLLYYCLLMMMLLPMAVM